MPAALAGDAVAHFGPIGAEAFEVAVLEVDAGGAVWECGEEDFDVAGFGGVGFVLPGGVDFPGDDQAAWRVPFGNFAPGTVGAVFLLGVAAAAEAAFEDGALHGGFADVVGAGPPAVEVFGEDFEGVLLGGFDGDSAVNDVFPVGLIRDWRRCSLFFSFFVVREFFLRRFFRCADLGGCGFFVRGRVRRGR